MTEVLLFQQWQKRLYRVDGSPQVNIEYPLPVLQFDISRRGWDPDPGITADDMSSVPQAAQHPPTWRRHKAVSRPGHQLC
jgi:hypothetical protein